MTDKPDEAEALKRQLDELDGQIERLVASLDPDAPEAHQPVYVEIERIHQEIAAVRQRAKAVDPLH